MEIKIKLDQSFFTGFFTGILLSLILVSAAFGIAATAYRIRSAQNNYPYPEGMPPSPAGAPSAAAGPSQGSGTATIMLQEFSDFHCPFCKHAAPTIEQLLEKFPGKIKREYHH